MKIAKSAILCKKWWGTGWDTGGQAKFSGSERTNWIVLCPYQFVSKSNNFVVNDSDRFVLFLTVNYFFVYTIFTGLILIDLMDPEQREDIFWGYRPKVGRSFGLQLPLMPD